MRGFLSSLNPRLPRAVQLLQLGGLMNAFGNGLVVPFLLIYLHNERGIGLGVAGLVLATNAGGQPDRRARSAARSSTASAARRC